VRDQVGEDVVERVGVPVQCQVSDHAGDATAGTFRSRPNNRVTPTGYG
jgi:hypothetical protein